MIGWSRADLHMHTTCSDGMHTPAQLAERLAVSGLAVAAVTDHDTVEGALRVEEALGDAGPELVVGTEISSADGHILALFVSRDVPPGMSAEATVSAIHAQDGLAVAAHPYSLALGVGDLAARLPFDGLEVINGSPFMEYSNARAVRRLGALPAAIMASSDAHVAQAVGHVHTLFPGSSAADLRAAIVAGWTKPGVDWAGRLATLPQHLGWLTWLTLHHRPAALMPGPAPYPGRRDRHPQRSGPTGTPT